MEYIVERRIADNYTDGFQDDCCYLLVNTVGYYSIEDCTKLPTNTIYRANGLIDYFLCYVHEGEMNVHLDNSTHTVSNGAFLYPPHARTFYSSLNRKPLYTIFWVSFTGYGVEEILKLSGINNNYIMNTGAIEELPPLFKTIAQELNLKIPGHEAVCSSLLMYILSILGRSLNNKSNINYASKDSRIHKVLDFIQSNYQKRIALSDLADVTNLSTSRFSTLFRENLGMPPQQYLINYRVQKACELIKHTSYPIGEIAFFVGFDDPLYFSRIFKKQTGFSPTEYKKRSENGIFSVK